MISSKISNQNSNQFHSRIIFYFLNLVNLELVCGGKGGGGANNPNFRQRTAPSNSNHHQDILQPHLTKKRERKGIIHFFFNYSNKSLQIL